MTGKQGSAGRIDWSSDWWLLPTAFLLALGGLGQATWMWDNVGPQGMAPLWLLLWTGIGIAGVTLPVFWLARRWWPAAWITTAAWVGVPAARNMALRYEPAASGVSLDRFAPLLFLLLLGVGLSGVMMNVSWYAARRWSGSVPNSRGLRGGFWSGLFSAICGWLLINGLLTAGSAGLLACALILIEVYLVIREAPSANGKT